jgi:hypothetical protein
MEARRRRTRCQARSRCRQRPPDPTPPRGEHPMPSGRATSDRPIRQQRWTHAQAAAHATEGLGCVPCLDCQTTSKTGPAATSKSGPPRLRRSAAVVGSQGRRHAMQQEAQAPVPSATPRRAGNTPCQAVRPARYHRGAGTSAGSPARSPSTCTERRTAWGRKRPMPSSAACSISPGVSGCGTPRGRTPCTSAAQAAERPRPNTCARRLSPHASPSLLSRNETFMRCHRPNICARRLSRHAPLSPLSRNETSVRHRRLPNAPRHTRTPGQSTPPAASARLLHPAAATGDRMDNTGRGRLAMTIGGGNLATHRNWAAARGRVMDSSVLPAAGA